MRERFIEPIAHLRDVDGTGSLHPCAAGDDGAIPVVAYRRRVCAICRAVVAEHPDGMACHCSARPWKEQQ